MGPRIRIASMLAALVVACGGAAPLPPRAARTPGRRRTVTVAPASPASYWKGLDVTYDPDLKAPALPVDAADLVRDEGAAQLYANLPADARASLLREGWVVVKPERARTHMGVFYTDLQEGHVPIVLTLDALVELVHLGISAAVTETHARAERPALLDWLARVEARLAVERKNAPSDLAAPYKTALAFVAVARSLGDAAYVPAPEFKDVVAKERAAIAARSAIARSAATGAALDYRAFPPATDQWFRAWLALAPFTTGDGEDERRHVDVARARMLTRAALLLARATDARVDPDAAAAFARAREIELFFSGRGDDVDLAALAEIAPKAGVDLTDGATIAKVVRVDALRSLLAKAPGPKLLQGETGVRSIRALAASAPIDGVALQELVTPEVPLRSMPCALDVATWLGSEEAKKEITARGDDKLAGYSRALVTLYAERPPDPHASVYTSALDTIAAMLAPSVSFSACPAAKSPSYAKVALESGLSAWTTLRGDFSGATLARLEKAPPSPAATPHASPALVYVEPRIESIARLTALVRQTLSGLDAMKALPADAPARAVLHDADELLTVAFEVALLAANDEAPTAAQRALLSTLPAWMDSLETAMASSTPRSVVVHVDRMQGSALVESTEQVQTLYLALREPATGRLVLVAGAHVPHVEKAVPLHESK